MQSAAPRTHDKPLPDLTSRAYWNSTIKMGLTKFFILCVLHQRPMHGYDIARAVAHTTDGCCTPAEATIYPTLRLFQEGGYVTSHTEVVGGRERRVYALTDKGKEAFAVAVDAWMEVTDCLQRAGHRARARDRKTAGDGAGCC